MSIKVIVLDLSGTTFKNGELQDGMEELLVFCNKIGLKIAFVTNNLFYRPKLKNKKIQFDCLVTPIKARNRKPSPAFIRCIEKELVLSKDRFIYVGDSDKNDAFCASNAKVLYFSALWANPDAQYGIPIKNPHRLKNYILKYLLKENYWGWELDRYDSKSNRLRAFALLDGQSCIKNIAVDTFKWGEIKHRRFFLSHLIASIYLSGIYKEVDYWATYPSHNMGSSVNKIMEEYIKIASKEFRDKYIDLFIRHTTSIDSGASRQSGLPLDFKNQIGTVHLNPSFRKKIKNKRFLVLDDFITQGFSGECARNLLYNAGAGDVVCVGIAKYGQRYNQIEINSKYDSFNPIKIDEIKYRELTVSGVFNPSAKAEIESSFSLKSADD